MNRLISKLCDRSFRSEVYGLFVVLSPQESTSQRRHTIEYWMSRFLESFHRQVGCGFLFSFRRVACVSIRLLLTSRSKDCPVPLREFLHVIHDLFGNLKYIFLNFLSSSNQYHRTSTWGPESHRRAPEWPDCPRSLASQLPPGWDSCRNDSHRSHGLTLFQEQ